MKKNSLKLVFLTLAFFLLTAGRTAPIYNVEKADVPAKLKVETIKKSIIRAGLGLGWEMKADKPGHILGTLHLRSHTAIIDVTYNTKNYNIKYKDSVNLDHSGDVIHANYNNWIRNLDKHIQMELQTR